MARISIIMPVYNVAEYLHNCVDSIFAQKFTDWELILVDDGSTDASLSICEEYVAKDARVKLVRRAHSNAAACRNAGIRVAAGEYLMFLDSDDVFSPWLLDRLYGNAEVHGADISACTSVAFIDGRPEPEFKEPTKNDCFEVRFDGLCNPLRMVATMPWNKIFSRKLVELHDLRFLEQSSTNDLTFVALAISLSEKTVMIEEPLIAYRQRAKSIQSTKDPRNYFNAIREYMSRLEAKGGFASLGDAVKEAFADFYTFTVLWELRTQVSKSAYFVIYNGIRDLEQLLKLAEGKCPRRYRAIVGACTFKEWWQRTFEAIFAWILGDRGRNRGWRKSLAKRLDKYHDRTFGDDFAGNPNICIDIFSLDNRGDWLMFESILQEVRRRFPLSRISVPQQTYEKNSAFYRDKGVVSTVDLGKCSFRQRIRIWRKTHPLKRKSPMPENDVELLLFSPGFRYSDQFGLAYVDWVAEDVSRFAKFKRTGCKVVLMPQAFGPFENPTLRKTIGDILELADKVYAREQVSASYLEKCFGHRDNVSVVPDFTCLYKGEPTKLEFAKKDYVVVVPNRQMLARTKSGIASKYCDFMIATLRKLVSRGENIVLLNHEGVLDDGLISVLNGAIDNKAKIVRDVSGGVCKSVIAGSKLTLTSRFHGLVSALTTSVPALCTSWSHKYQELSAELGRPEACLDLNDVDGSLARVEDALANPAKYIADAVKLQEYKGQVIRMWAEIEALLEG